MFILSKHRCDLNPNRIIFFLTITIIIFAACLGLKGLLDYQMLIASLSEGPLLSFLLEENFRIIRLVVHFSARSGHLDRMACLSGLRYWVADLDFDIAVVVKRFGLPSSSESFVE